MRTNAETNAMTAKKNVLRPVDENARRFAKTLIRTARYGTLAVIDQATGYPLASRINAATTMEGCPTFLISRLAPHFRALEKDSRCSILFGTPGKGDPLAHPRITVAGHARRLPETESPGPLRNRFLMRHPKSALYVDFGDFAFWRVEPEFAQLNGGFGKAYELSAADILTDLSDDPSILDQESSIVTDINENSIEIVDRCAWRVKPDMPHGWRLASFDREGADLARRDDLMRVWFETSLTSTDNLARMIETSQACEPL